MKTLIRRIPHLSKKMMISRRQPVAIQAKIHTHLLIQAANS